MIIGTSTIPYGIEKTICRTSEEYELSEVGDYKVHSTTLMPFIDFDEADEWEEDLDDSIFINDEETEIVVNDTIDVQNFITTNYIGRAPLEFYGPKTELGRQFVMLCEDGKPGYDYRVFGTEEAIQGFNRNANDNSILPK